MSFKSKIELIKSRSYPKRTNEMTAQSFSEMYKELLEVKPSFVSEEAKNESINIEEIKIINIVDDKILTDGYAIFDPVELTFTCYTPPYVSVVSVNLQEVAVLYITRKFTHYSTFHNFPKIFAIQVEETSKPACMWFSPSEAQIKNGSVQIDNYPYHVARKAPGCNNPELTGSKANFMNCNYSNPVTGGFNSCTSASLSSWETIAESFEGDQSRFAIQRSYFAMRVPQYKLVDASGNVIVDKTDDITLVTKTFDELSEGLNIVTPAKNKKSYFKAILTS